MRELSPEDEVINEVKELISGTSYLHSPIFWGAPSLLFPHPSSPDLRHSAQTSAQSSHKSPQHSQLYVPKMTQGCKLCLSSPPRPGSFPVLTGVGITGLSSQVLKSESCASRSRSFSLLIPSSRSPALVDFSSRTRTRRVPAFSSLWFCFAQNPALPPNMFLGFHSCSSKSVFHTRGMRTLQKP